MAERNGTKEPTNENDDEDVGEHRCNSVKNRRRKAIAVAVISSKLGANTLNAWW
jgi:hypothetical protein